MIKKFLRGASCTMLALLLALLLIPQPVQAAGASLSGSSSIQAKIQAERDFIIGQRAFLAKASS